MTSRRRLWALAFAVMATLWCQSCARRYGFDNADEILLDNKFMELRPSLEAGGEVALEDLIGDFDQFSTFNGYDDANVVEERFGIESVNGASVHIADDSDDYFVAVRGGEVVSYGPAGPLSSQTDVRTSDSVVVSCEGQFLVVELGDRPC